MAKKKTFGIDDLWQVERLGAPSLAPDGAQAVATLATASMEDNKSSSALWLLSTLGGAPRRLTACGDKDGSPRWSPDGQLIAFTAKREQEGTKDEEPQLYLIAPDGGEARRAAEVATGVEAFRWCPDGRRLLFVSWVWPELEGAKAQARQHKAFKARKESGYATSQAQYRYWDHNVPMGRVPHLHLLELGRDGQPGRPRDLFAGTPYELSRSEPDANHFDVSPDGRHAVFAFDPAAEKRSDDRFALAEIDLRSGRVRVLAQDADWDFSAPRYSPDGERIAFVASHQGRSTPCRGSWRCSAAASWLGRSSAPSGTTRCTRRCTGKTTARPCSSPPSRRAARTCGASTCPTAAPRWWWPAAGSAPSTRPPARW